MARKEKRFHYIYKITNKKDGKYYIGMHSTDNLDDDYFGSGKRITNSIRRHGKDSHTKEILEYFEDRESLRKREIELVNEDLLNDPMCMNLQPGGGGGFINEKHMKKCSSSGGRGFSEKLKNDADFRLHFKKLTSETIKKAWKDGAYSERSPTFKDKKHTEDTKKIIGEKNSINRIGNKNSQFGTRWVNKNQEDKKIKGCDLNEYLNDGWLLGRNKK